MARRNDSPSSSGESTVRYEGIPLITLRIVQVDEEFGVHRDMCSGCSSGGFICRRVLLSSENNYCYPVASCSSLVNFGDACGKGFRRVRVTEPLSPSCMAFPVESMDSNNGGVIYIISSQQLQSPSIISWR